MYVGDFSSKEDVCNQYGVTLQELENVEILYASYTYEDYSGNSLVIFMKEGKLYENHGSHCSCNGLEGQWEPEETSWEAISIRPSKNWKDEEEYEGLDKVLTSYYFERDVLKG